MGLTKEMAKGLLKGDFIPGGERVDDVSNLSFRKTEEGEVFQCCAQTGHDPQSGPTYCGEIAGLVAFIKKDGVVTGLVALCNVQHKVDRGMVID